MQLLDHCFRPGQSRRTVAYSGCIHCIIQNPRRRRLSQPTSSIAFTLIKIPPPLPHYQSRSSARSAHWFLSDPANGYVSSARTKAAATALDHLQKNRKQADKLKVKDKKQKLAA